MSPLHSIGKRPLLGANTAAPIPAGWEAHHMPTAEAILKSPGTIHRVTAGPPPFPKPPGWEGTGQIYSGLFEVTQLNREGGGVPGEQPTRERTYIIACKTDIPGLQTGERGDLVRVEGREFRVQAVMFGTRLWQMNILCTDNMTQQNPV